MICLSNTMLKAEDKGIEPSPPVVNRMGLFSRQVRQTNIRLSSIALSYDHLLSGSTCPAHFSSKLTMSDSYQNLRLTLSSMVYTRFHLQLITLVEK